MGKCNTHSMVKNIANSKFEFCTRPDDWSCRRNGDETSFVLMNHVDSQSAKAWASKRGLGRMKHVMLKHMYVQDVVEKKLTNLAYISTKQMTKCHIRSTHEGLRDDRIETRLKQNKEVKMQREKKSISSDEEEMRTRRQVKKSEIR